MSGFATSVDKRKIKKKPVVILLLVVHGVETQLIWQNRERLKDMSKEKKENLMLFQFYHLAPKMLKKHYIKSVKTQIIYGTLLVNTRKYYLNES